MNIVEERGRDYGHPIDNFKKTANILNEMNFRVYNQCDNTYRMIDPKDIPVIMIGVKMAREAYKHKDDNILDILGYAKTYFMLDNQLELL